MSDIIKLLPDALANQIAAGEVVQRPASVVKELMENAIDAGATNITLILKEGGKSAIQVVDNGSGMSETDARLSFERHATSKIRETNDLFAIKTMGFRGEALASIAAVAQVELKTRQSDDELATRILVEGSTVVLQEPCQAPVGTSITVRSLFFNVPARKQFLKSDIRELSIAEEEFKRIALAHPSVSFALYINEKEAYKLQSGNLRQRIVSILGNNLNEKLIPIEEDTDLVKLTGYIGSPETAKKRRGDQYLYVNQRFIKSNYLNHAIVSAYTEVLTEGHFPFYVIFLEIDPGRIDVNVHPTKQEIKFEDERIVYNYLKVAARHALSKYHVTPSIDFDQDPVFRKDASMYRPEGFQSPDREGNRYSSSYSGDDKRNKDWTRYYEKLFSRSDTDEIDGTDPEGYLTLKSDTESEKEEIFDGRENWTAPDPYQIHNCYVVCHIRSGVIIVDQQAAHERILYERYLQWMESGKAMVQKEMFPKVVSVKLADKSILDDILPELVNMGLAVAPFGNTEYVIHGTPAVSDQSMDPEELLLNLIEQYKDNLDLHLSVKEGTASAMARATAMKRGKRLSSEEMRTLADQLFSCEMPFKSPTGRKCFITLELDDLEKRFKN